VVCRLVAESVLHSRKSANWISRNKVVYVIKQQRYGFKQPESKAPISQPEVLKTELVDSKFNDVWMTYPGEVFKT